MSDNLLKHSGFKLVAAVILPLFIMSGLFGVLPFAQASWIDTSKEGTPIALDAETPSVWGNIVAFAAGGIIRYYDVSTGVTMDTGKSGYATSIYDGVIAYRDGRDLKTFIIQTGVETDTHVKAIGLCIFGDYIVISTDEQDVGDLNGDGDDHDYVIRVYRISTGELTNTGADGRLPSIDPNYGLVAFYTDESSVDSYPDGIPGRQVLADFNGDGDSDDRFVRFYDMSTKEVSIFKEAYNPHLQDGYLTFFVLDPAYLDIYGRPTTVLHTYDLTTQEETDLGVVGWRVWHSGNIISLHVCEWQVGDINVDGDVNEQYVMYYNRVEGKLYNSGIEGSEPKVSGDIIIYEGSLGYFEIGEGWDISAILDAISSARTAIIAAVNDARDGILSAISGLSAKIDLIRTDLDSWFGAGGRYSRTAQVTSGSGSTTFKSTSSFIIYTSGKIGAVTVSIKPSGMGTGESLIVRYYINPARSTVYIYKTVSSVGLTDTVAVWKVEIYYVRKSGTDIVDWAYSAIYPP